MMRRLAGLAAGCTMATVLHAQGARLTITPARPEPGAIVRITVADSAPGADSITAVSGTMAGEPLHFVALKRRARRAIGAVPVDSGMVAAIEILVTRASGKADTLRRTIEPPPLPAPSEQLAVTRQYGTPMDSATEARVEAESERARELGRRSHGSPALWTAPFQRPRASAVTSRFGTGRTFNGQVTSRHLGVDFKGASGEPIVAANRGVVALVDTTFLGGRVVYVDHGAGIVTAYMHLSKSLVAAGDTVKRGQRIALVGATGRVTGPHLHWGARYGALTVNPLDLLALEAVDAPRTVEPVQRVAGVTSAPVDSAPIAPATPAAPAAATPTSISKLGWLAGCLVARDSTRTVEEQRMAPRGGTMLGMGRTASATGTDDYELTLIVEREGKLLYEAHPKGQAPASFTATLANADSVVFSNPLHDFPQEVGYRRVGADSVLAWVAAGAKRIEFRYVRVACPSAP